MNIWFLLWVESISNWGLLLWIIVHSVQLSSPSHLEFSTKIDDFLLKKFDLSINSTFTTIWSSAKRILFFLRLKIQLTLIFTKKPLFYYVSRHNVVKGFFEVCSIFLKIRIFVFWKQLEKKEVGTMSVKLLNSAGSAFSLFRHIT